MRRHTRRSALVLLCALALLPLVGAGSAQASSPQADDLASIRAQLKWYPQAQFAGWYAATDLGYFAEEGLAVTTLPGVPGVNPVASLLDGTADVAVASMAQAALLSTPERRIVNVAQVLQEPDSLLICRARPGFLSANDLRGATVASSPDREAVIRSVFARIFPDGGEPRLVGQRPDIESLTTREADCVWGSVFNEYWRVQDAGYWHFTVDPADYGVLNIEDGVYVEEQRLADPAFRESVAGAVRALERGWAFSAEQPASAVQMVLTRDPSLDRFAQERQLASILPLLGDDFGYFDLARYQVLSPLGAPQPAPEIADDLWTHEIYTMNLSREGSAGYVTPVTRYYVGVVQGALWYQLLIGMGVFCFATSGALIGLRLGYRFWGRLVLAFMPALAGGLVRDLLLGGDRYPPPAVYDPIGVYLVIAAALLVTVLARTAGDAATVERVDVAADRLGAIGFALFAVHGTLVAVGEQAPLVWALASAALTVAGGGILLDILIRREHDGFRGRLYEEIGILGSVLVLAGLWFAGQHEHTPWLVLATVLTSMAATLAVYALVARRGITYPRRSRAAAPADAEPEPVGVRA